MGRHNSYNSPKYRQKLKDATVLSKLKAKFLRWLYIRNSPFSRLLFIWICKKDFEKFMEKYHPKKINCKEVYFKGHLHKRRVAEGYQAQRPKVKKKVIFCLKTCH